MRPSPSQLAALSDLLTVDAEAVEGVLLPAEHQLQNLVQILQREVVGYGEDAGNEGGDVQEDCSQQQALRGLGHPPTPSPPTSWRSPIVPILAPAPAEYDRVASG
jgi:hypothetical protein